jgi:hypothetical protein
VKRDGVSPKARKRRMGLGLLLTIGIVFGAGEVFMSQASASARANVVLVHGGFVDGSGWEGVYKALKKEGYAVTIVQNQPSPWRMTWR